MSRPISPLQVKSEAFSQRIVRLYNYLKEKKKEGVMSKQVYRSGTSVGANIAESRYAQSSADFVSKLSIALKESGETEYWLKSLHGGGFLTDEEFSSIYNDNVEIGKMLTSSIKTMKKKMGVL
ncbi:MAG: four helix bundle protein [Prevotella sp.]|nr:four helix bundle protein [Prevotella sp.]